MSQVFQTPARVHLAPTPPKWRGPAVDTTEARLKHLERRVSILWCVFIVVAIIVSVQVTIVVLNAAADANHAGR